MGLEVKCRDEQIIRVRSHRIKEGLRELHVDAVDRPEGATEGEGLVAVGGVVGSIRWGRNSSRAATEQSSCC